MPREQIRHDVPKEWAENLKHGRCWCGKDHTQFEKRMKFFCCKAHADEYNKRTMYWSAFKEEFLAKNGRQCAKCGMTEKKFEALEEARQAEFWANEAAKYPEAIKVARAKMILDLEKEFAKIQDDSYVLQHMHWQIRQDADIPHLHFQHSHFYIEVDHIKAVALGGDMWNTNNLQVLCTPCHQEKTREDMKKLRALKK